MHHKISFIKNLGIVISILMAVNANAGQTVQHVKCSEIESVVNREDYEHITIQRVMRESLRASPDVRKSILNHQNSLDDIVIARSAMLPQVGLNYEAGFTHSPVNQGVLGDIEVSLLSVSANWLVFDSGVVKNQVVGAHARAERAQSLVANQEYLTAMQAAESYVAVLRQRIALDFALAAYDDVRKIKSLIAEKKVASETDIAKALQVKETICSSAREFYRQNIDATNFFISVLDYDPETFYLVEPEQVGVELDINRSMELAQINHPSFHAIEAQSVDSEAQSAAAYGELGPKVSIVTSLHSYDHESKAFGDRSRDGWYAGIRGNVPLYTGGRTSANISKASRNKDIVAADYESLIRKVRRSISGFSASIKTSTDQLRQLKTVVEESEKLYQEGLRTLIKTKSGKPYLNSQDLINLLDERSNFYKAQVELNSVYYSLILDRFNLLAQQGLLMRELNN